MNNVYKYKFRDDEQNKNCICMIISSDHVKASALWKEFFLRSWKYFFCWRCLGEKYARTKYFNNDFSAYFSRYGWKGKERNSSIKLLCYMKLLRIHKWGKIEIRNAAMTSNHIPWIFSFFSAQRILEGKKKPTHERWMYMASYAFFSNVTTVSTS